MDKKSSLYKKLLSVYLLYLLVLTLNPYDFSIEHLKHLLSFDLKNFLEFIFHFNIWDFALNIIFFIPAGVLFSSIKAEKNKSELIRYQPIVFYGLLISLCIELIQLFLDRSTSVIDLMANGLGTFTGVYLFNSHRHILFRTIRNFSVELNRSLRVFIAYSFLMFLMVTASLPYFLNTPSSWIDSFHLLIGNEPTLNRGWEGEIYKAAVYKKELSKNEVSYLFKIKNDFSEKNRQMMKNAGCIALYDFSVNSGQEIFNEKISDNITLRLKGDNYDRVPGGIKLSGKSVLKSMLPARDIIKELKSTNQFSVEAWIKTSDLNQQGPARILTISDGPDNRNFTLAQKGKGIHFRVSTFLAGKNGSRINLRAKNVINDTLIHHIVATFNHGVEKIAVDGKFVSQRVYGDMDYIPYIFRLGTNFLSKIAYYLLFPVLLGVLFYSIGEPLREVRAAGAVIIYIIFVQIFYYIKAAQTMNPEFIAAGIIAAVSSLYIGRLIKTANAWGCLK